MAHSKELVDLNGPPLSKTQKTKKAGDYLLADCSVQDIEIFKADQ